MELFRLWRPGALDPAKHGTKTPWDILPPVQLIQKLALAGIHIPCNVTFVGSRITGNPPTTHNHTTYVINVSYFGQNSAQLFLSPTLSPQYLISLIKGWGSRQLTFGFYLSILLEIYMPGFFQILYGQNGQLNSSEGQLTLAITQIFP